MPFWVFGVARVHVDVRDPLQLIGLVAIAIGAALLFTCVWEFARTGRGTLSPVDPPRELVVRGLYRYVRNPMYVSVTVMLLGEVWLARSWALFLYWAVWFALVSVFVIWYEEPALRRQFGESYERYTREVRRWVPRRRVPPETSLQ